MVHQTAPSWKERFGHHRSQQHQRFQFKCERVFTANASTSLASHRGLRDKSTTSRSITTSSDEVKHKQPQLYMGMISLEDDIDEETTLHDPDQPHHFFNLRLLTFRKKDNKKHYITSFVSKSFDNGYKGKGREKLILIWHQRLAQQEPPQHQQQDARSHRDDFQSRARASSS